MLLSVGIWYYLEPFFTLFGAISQIVLAIMKRSKPSLSLLWIVSYIVAPIVTFGAYIMVGRAAFLRPVELPATRSSNGNEVRLITDGKEYYDSLFEDILHAKCSVYIECYLIRLDQLSERFIELLCSKASEGVVVKVLFDDFGYDAKDKRYVKKLTRAGAECRLFHNMTLCMFSPKKNYRNHRKIAVVDGYIGYTGGFNIGEEYLTDWMDIAVRMMGPGVDACTEGFVRIWDYTEPGKPGVRETSNTDQQGDCKISVINGNPVIPTENPLRKNLRLLIEKSSKNICIVTPYFNPDKEMINLIKRKMEKGVRVTIMIPSIADHPLVFWSNRFNAYRLMKSGAETYEFTGGFLHEKVVVSDDQIISLGSANFDRRSTELNFECNVDIESKEFCESMEKHLETLMSSCRKYTIDDYESRSLLERIKTLLARLNSSQL